MNVQARLQEDRRKTNPVFNDRKLKLGTFGTNLDRGCAISTIDGVLEINWPNTLELARCSEEMEFEALVPIGRWHGFGGHTNFNGPGFECFSWAAGDRRVDQILRHLRHLARADHPSGDGGEAGDHHRPRHRRPLRAQHRHRLEPAGDRDVRLAADGARRPLRLRGRMAHIMKQLWTRDEPFDFEGRFYKIKKGYLQPKPVQRPFPAVMNAGGSDKGQHFAAKYCDMVYVVFGSHDFDDCKAKVDAYRELARKEYGREIQIWSYAYVVQGDTEKEAQAYFDEYVNQKGDWDAVDQPGRHHDRQRQDAAEGGAGRDEEALHRRLGRLSDHRHAGADRRRPCSPCRRWGSTARC